MATINSSDLERALKKKGFKNSKTDHQSYFLVYQGVKREIGTCVSHGGSYDLGHDLIKDTKDELHMSKDQLFKFVECSFGEEDYIKLLKSKGILPPES